MVPLSIWKSTYPVRAFVIILFATLTGEHLWPEQPVVMSGLDNRLDRSSDGVRLLLVVTVDT